ncbi:unnamed protein product [Cuscuta campestris]|uniref:Uncharacterized protein n=1 Tax=Cuscuta campestris TaxID=132261 RepID=A0A484KEL3_9ASTE|nr:unnamed protein product [Cuscuta campestris]
MVRTKIALHRQRTKNSCLKKELWAKHSWPRLLAMEKAKHSEENQKSKTSGDGEEISPNHALGNSKEQCTDERSEGTEGRKYVEDDVLLHPLAEIPDTLYLEHTPAQPNNDMQRKEEEDLKQGKKIPDLVEEEPLIACSDVPFEDSQITTPVSKKKRVKISGSRWSLRQKAKEDQEAESVEEIQSCKVPKEIKTKEKAKDEQEECTKRQKRSPATERLTTRSQSSKKKDSDAEKSLKLGKFPNQVFISSIASSFMSEIAKKSILPQRSIDVDDFETKTNLIPVLKQSHLLKSVTIPGSYVRRIIQEFYCNLNESCNTFSDPSFHKGLDVADEEEPAPPLLQVDMRHFEGRHQNDMVKDESQRTATAFLGSDFSQTAFLRTEIQLLQEQIDRHKALIKEAKVKKKKLAIILSSLDTNTGSTAQPQGEKSQEDAPEEDDATQGGAK